MALASTLTLEGRLNQVNMHNDISRQNKNICIYVNRVNNIDKTVEDFKPFQNKSGTTYCQLSKYTSLDKNNITEKLKYISTIPKISDNHS